MQGRMKQHQLSKDEIDDVLRNAQTGCIATHNEKEKILHAIVAKYTPQLSHLSFPEKMMKATGIIEIEPVEITGKYYK